MHVDDSVRPGVVVREPGRTPLHLILHGPLEVGRDCSGLLIDDPQVSRCHLQLRPTEHGVIVEDLASSNGTFIGDHRISEPALLAEGSRVRLGDTTIELIGRGAAALEQEHMSGLTSIERVADEVVASVPSLSARLKPDTTITIVFTDIESSTEMAATVGDDRWFEVISDHNRLLRSLVAEHRGVEVKSQGDGFMLVFDSTWRALQAMVAIQREVSSTLSSGDPPVRIRVGAHTGEAIADEHGDLFGSHVNYAARIANEAAGGEILVSSLLKEIVEPRGEFTFGEVREAALKGFSGSHRMFPVQWR